MVPDQEYQECTWPRIPSGAAYVAGQLPLLEFFCFQKEQSPAIQLLQSH